MSEIKLNRNHTNVNIVPHLHDSNYMRTVGFREKDKYWYFCRDIADDITFNVRIPKTGINDDLNIFVVDEWFLQPYDYQHILFKNPDDKLAKEIKNKVEHWMKYLKDKNILSGHNYGDYI